MPRKFTSTTDSILRTDNALSQVWERWNDYKLKRADYAAARERFETMSRQPWNKLSAEEFVEMRDKVQKTHEAYMEAIKSYKEAYFQFKSSNRVLIQNKQLSLIGLACILTPWLTSGIL